MTLLYYDPRFLSHDTGSHPECARRLVHVMDHLEKGRWTTTCQRPTWEPITTERLTRIHAPRYVVSLRRYAASGGGRIEADTIVSTESESVARLAAGSVVDAVERVLGGPDPRALCLVRPPGHHALRDGPMGFCLYNNVALGCMVAIVEHGVERILIVDWDVHHGNGTQDAFYEDARVGFLSIHRYPFYPGSGAADETGTGPGLGMTVNLPIAWGTPRAAYLDRFRAAVENFAGKVRPELVLISAGFDSHREDPIGSLGLEVEDFAVLTQIVVSISEAYAAGRIVSVLEGGYNPAVLAQCVGIHLEHLAPRKGASGDDVSVGG